MPAEQRCPRWAGGRSTTRPTNRTICTTSDTVPRHLARWCLTQISTRFLSTRFLAPPRTAQHLPAPRTVAVPVAANASATHAGSMCCLMLSNCWGSANALTVLREPSRCMTFSVEDRYMVTSPLPKGNKRSYPQEILINFDHLRANRSALLLARFMATSPAALPPACFAYASAWVKERQPSFSAHTWRCRPDRWAWTRCSPKA
jgi:hypothetical protein